MNIDATILVWLAATALEFFAVRYLCRRPLRGKLANFLVGLFAALFTVSLILGEHIVVGDAYSGLYDVNYITSYSVIDICASAFVFPGIFALSAAPVARARGRGQANEGLDAEIALKPLGARWVAMLSLLVLLLWTPYLVIYWPGFIFGDTLSSINQALGYSALSNHHPVAYTLFLAACFKVAGFLGLGHTAGIGLSTAIQMAFMAFGFGYLSRWIVVRGSFKPMLGVVIAAAFGLCSYIGSFSVALWKDPIFSSAGLLFTICLADLALSHGKAARRKGWVALFAVGALLMMFLRNNGVFVVALVCVFMVAICLLTSAKAHKRKILGYLIALATSVATLAIYAVVSGPGYAALGVVPTETSEAVGIPLNQMARVAALGGEMTESDKEYLGSIIPFDEYPNRYYPCCTDNLKWSEGFDNEALQNGMWSHWLSMLVRNPNAYFQAWELQTFGFWAVNTEKQDAWSWNVGGGVPRNISAEGAQQLWNGYQINLGSLARSEKATSMFPVDSWSVPISWLLWVSCYLALLLCLAKKPLWAFGLIPSIGVLLTLLVASPIAYWPRYGALLQFCIPLYAFMFYLALVPKGHLQRVFSERE